MKIKKVEIIPGYPYKMPFRVSSGMITSGSQLIVRIALMRHRWRGSRLVSEGPEQESAIAKIKSIASGLSWARTRSIQRRS
jgi:hypothetical protein